MPLPKLKTPIFETILPSTGKVFKYRPFLVKEEKILLTALEDESGESLPIAIKQIINNCVQGKLDVEDLPTFDIEYLFLRLRAKSIGEKVTLGLKPWGCPNNEKKLCPNFTKVELNLEEVNVQKKKGHTTKIMIDDQVGIKMKYPNADSLMPNKKSDTENGMNILKKSIDIVFTKDKTYERESFTDKELDEFFDSLDSKQFKKIKNFFDDMPVLKHTVKYKCETCGEEKETVLQGLNSFFG